MNILVTGAAGFIGSVLVERLIEAGHEVIGFDNFVNSYRDDDNERIRFASLANFSSYFMTDFGNIDCVVHMAAESLIGDSTTKPHDFYQTNVVDSLRLLEVMRWADCKNIVFSSTASVYGEAVSTPMDESHPINPINAYGESKWMFERILEWYRKAYGFRYCIFRYFNVGGATELHGENRRVETRLVPTTIDAVLNNGKVKIFGADWDTYNGTCLRDFVHVKDIADAHILGIKNLSKKDNGIYNLGGERAYSVLEIISRLEKIAGKSLKGIEFTHRRPGDPEKLLASSELAKKELGWKPKYSDIQTILEDSYRWRYEHIGLLGREVQYQSEPEVSH